MQKSKKEKIINDLKQAELFAGLNFSNWARRCILGWHLGHFEPGSNWGSQQISALSTFGTGFEVGSPFCWSVAVVVAVGLTFLVWARKKVDSLIRGIHFIRFGSAIHSLIYEWKCLLIASLQCLLLSSLFSLRTDHIEIINFLWAHSNKTSPIFIFGFTPNRKWSDCYLLKNLSFLGVIDLVGYSCIISKVQLHNNRAKLRSRTYWPKILFTE